MGAPRRHSPLLQAVGRIAMRVGGWRFEGALPELPKFIIIVAPHTSNWDFPVGVAAMFALDLRIHWFGKDSLFKPPHGFLFKVLGGRGIRRDTREGVVAEMAAVVRAEPQFLLALAPEGTRKRVAQWRSGFYHIAEAADVPIVPVWFDYRTKVIGIQPPMRASGNIDADFATLQALFRPEMAKRPDGFWGP